jgi:hypothetical protein
MNRATALASAFLLATLAMPYGWGVDSLVTNPTAQLTSVSPLLIDTTIPGIWVTAPFAFLDSKKKEFDLYAKGTIGPGWTTPHLTLSDLYEGVKISTNHLLNGTASLEWHDLPRYPTVESPAVPSDWKNFRAIRLSLYSEKATGDIITLGVQTATTATPALIQGQKNSPSPSYWSKEFTVNWTGWKEFTFPFSEFEKIGEPAEWNNIQGLYFFSKCMNRSPDPRTVLSINRIVLLPNILSDKEQIKVASSLTNNDLLFIGGGEYGSFAKMNHDGPEVSRNLISGAPLIHQPYFSGARALYGYHPRYHPGAVSFDPQGKVYLRNNYSLDWLDNKGVWQETDFSSVLRDYALQQKWKGIGFGSGGCEPKVRFDRSGAVYLLVNVTQRIGPGKEDARFRSTLLLYATSLGKPWSLYKLPTQCDFENVDSFNQDALDHPPVIVREGNLFIPEKQKDGSLVIPKPVKFSDFAFTGSVHSGGGNFVISKGDMIYVVYAYLPNLPGPIPWTLVGDAKWKAEQPPVPANHPANTMTFVTLKGGQGSATETMRANGGMPTYVISYNRKTLKLSSPVFIGYGGSRMDPHNWSAMTIDSKGNLHVVLSGHCEPLSYTHTITPGDITHWSPPFYIKKSPASNDFTRCSYPSLNCDLNDNLLCIVRSDTDYYNHRLAVLSKPAGTEVWNQEQPLVVPGCNGYRVWHHRVSYNPESNRFFVGYCDSEYNVQAHSKEQDDFCSFIWPDTHGSDTDFTILASGDVGKTWHLATTPDFH